MPELPEVETVRRGLMPVLEGARLARVEQRRADLRWPLPERFGERLSGRCVARLDRRSKFILAALEPEPGRAPAETWIIHLGMTGRVLVGLNGSAPDVVGDYVYDTNGDGPHDHLLFDTDTGHRLVYNDVRRFGAMDLCVSDGLAEHPWLVRLGPEPLGNAFSGPVLAERLAGKATPIK
ncbi:MAG: DNA-formamidopyrimidine glycosylase family protein, partial [Pseudomonadota bacterium]